MRRAAALDALLGRCSRRTWDAAETRSAYEPSLQHSAVLYRRIPAVLHQLRKVRSHRGMERHPIVIRETSFDYRTSHKFVLLRI